MQEHHRVAVMDEALVMAVRLSNRYITGRQLPDKAVSVLDTACARVALGQTSQPGMLEDCRRMIDNLRTEISLLEKEQIKGSDHQRRLAQLGAELNDAEKREQELVTQWQRELELVKQLHELSEQTTGQDHRTELADLRAELAKSSG